MEGMKEADFWELTPGAVTRFLKASNERRKRDLKTEAVMLHRLADLIAPSVARLFGKNARFPEVRECFPTLFDYDEEEERAERSINNFKAFAALHNAKIGALNGNTRDSQRQADG